MSRKLCKAISIAGLIVIAAGGGYAIGTHPASAMKDWVDYATALGTVGAVIAAVGISVRQESLRREGAQIKANLVAASLSPRLTRFVTWLREGTGGLDFSYGPDETYSTSGELFAVLRECGSVKVSLDELSSLAPLPKRAAYRLARAISEYDLLFDEIAASVRRGIPQPADVPMAEDVVHEWSGRIDDILSLFEIAARECDDAAAIPAESPSGQERYGEP
jgi:hypothetical protein